MIIKLIDDQQVWENFLATHPGQNFLQSWSWNKFQESLGKRTFPLGFYVQQELKGTALLIKEQAKRGTYLACPGGPLLFWSEKRSLPVFVQIASRIAKAEKAWFIRLRPQLLDSEENKKRFTSFGWAASPMHMHAETTWQLKLDKSQEELLREMKKGHRYEINKAKRQGVKIVSSIDREEIELLYRLQLETAKRQKFIPFSKAFLINQFKAFVRDNQVRIFKAIYAGKPIAAAMIIFYGHQAVYHYAAGNQKAREVSAAYAICWQAILEAQKRGLQSFNFWGVAPQEKTSHRFTGLNHFKMGFGGSRISYLHALDLPLHPCYWLTYLFEKIRKLYRRL